MEEKQTFVDDLKYPPNIEPEEHHGISKKVIVAVFLIALVLGAGVTYATFQLKINANFTVPPAPAITATIIGSTGCSVSSDGQSATCPAITLPTSTSSTTLSTTVQNTGSGAVQISVGAVSSNPAVLTITPSTNNPTTIAGGSIATFQFTVQGVTGGTATITVTIGG